MIPNEANQRGKEFEDLVAGCLGLLISRHPKTVEVKHHPHLDLQNGTFVIPDFELTCTFPHQIDRRLIECQSRTKSSQDIAHRIRTIKSLSPRNRFILVFRDADYLSAAVKQALDADGVVCYPLLEFAAFLSKLSDALTAQAANEQAATKEAVAAKRVAVKQAAAAKRAAAKEAATKEPPRGGIKKLPQPPQLEMAKMIGQELGTAASREFMDLYRSFSQKGDQSMLPPRRGW
ncbi:MAG TPA: hypothetical protein VIA62_17965 [Thermoanaerobaculia bacterium]|nr:hypothetical protein [Thermoanaerobaculia bacterium]